ncbi:MAG: mechanosensitive ion channel family protein [Actinomycetota bacterium]
MRHGAGCVRVRRVLGADRARRGERPIDAIALRLFGLELTAGDIRAIVGRALLIGLVLLVAVLLIRAGGKVIDRVERRLLSEDRMLGRSMSRSRTLAEVSRSVLRVVVWTFAVLEGLQLLGVNLGPLIAGAGIAGVALGFGAQSLVRDFFSGFFVLLEDQYAVGDYVEIENARGTVERFNLRLTSVRASDGTLHHISNGHIRMVGNSSAGWTKAMVDVTVAYDEDLEKVEAALVRAAEELKDHATVGAIVLGPAEILGVESLADGNAVIRVAIKTAPGSRMTVARAFRAQVKKVFGEQGITIPTPHSILIQSPPKDPGPSGPTP